MTTYPYFRSLAAVKTLGIDYDIKNRYGTGDYLIYIAIHGGAMEPPTSQLAVYCADVTGAYYSFEALSDLTAATLSLSATTFDEPFCQVNVGNSLRAISFRGVEDQRESEEVAYVSGLDDVLVALVSQELTVAGFIVDTPPLRFEGSDPQNIVNRTRLRAGVQVDLTRSLRKSFYAGGDLSTAAVSNPANRLPPFFSFGDAIKRAAAQVPLTAEQHETPPVIRVTGAVDTSVSVAMTTPFAIDHTGAVASTTDQREQLVDRVHALVGTHPGERVMRATYGVPTSAALFAVNADAAHAQLERAVIDAVGAFEPSAVVSAVTADVDDEAGSVRVNVQVSRSDVPNAELDTTRTVGVLVGGTVVAAGG
ncbi:poly-gamma-glutamate hydrolase family protein [Streptomyces sp. NBC_01451]|uniref:poly-gamma-glutamate hydrolase family protein n=1 Tax=Streptomyces sp. NBC_01451 TaxID=2903872 RepID=UPI002E347156|nr:poly-gamma-glutamate hydrolase family protein [Streptomyces sp. NBC_01451]